MRQWKRSGRGKRYGFLIKSHDMSAHAYRRQDTPQCQMHDQIHHMAKIHVFALMSSTGFWSVQLVYTWVRSGEIFLSNLHAPRLHGGHKSSVMLEQVSGLLLPAEGKSLSYRIQ